MSLAFDRSNLVRASTSVLGLLAFTFLRTLKLSCGTDCLTFVLVGSMLESPCL